MIANGSDYYFSFKTIDVIRNGQLIKNQLMIIVNTRG